MNRILVATLVILLGSISFAQAYSIELGKPLWDQTDLAYSVDNRDHHDMSDADFYFEDHLGYKDASIYSGYYLGTIIGIKSGDDEFVQAIHDYCLAWAGQCIDIDKQYVYKAENDNNWTDGTLFVDFDGNEGDEHYGMSGTWAFSDQTQGFGFYAVKAGKEMAVYFVDPTQNEGIWSTMHVLNPAGQMPSISHLSGIDPPLSIVPEPSTLLSLGSALLVLGFAARRGRKWS